MRISSFKIRNFKSFHEPREIELGSGFNLIVGQNNVGKTALLEALQLDFQGKPHRSQLTAPTPTTVINPNTSAQVELAVSGTELRDILLELAEFGLPAKRGLLRNEMNGNEALEEILQLGEIKFALGLNAPQRGSSAFAIKKFPSHQLYEADDPSFFFRFVPSADKSRFNYGGDYQAAKDHDFGVQVANTLRTRIYRFDAQRIGLGSSRFGTNSVLSSTAGNLAEVLGILQHNRALFGDFNDLVHRIFPAIFGISVRPALTGGDLLEILVWSDERGSRREDLAIQLSESGTGVGQVLSLVYVVLTSKYPRTILIDEPSSFLHPAAARKLIEILKEFPQHQYIIATHSSEILRAASPGAVTLIRWVRPQSTIEPLEAGKLEEVRKCLIEVGAKLSDVYGADQILWVEGDTEEKCFPLIVAGHRDVVGTNVVGVKQTGDFGGKRIPLETIIGVYEKLSRGNALLPPAVGFIFDRESRTEAGMDELKVRSNGRIKFLPRAMYENYLLVPKALAALMNSLADFSPTPITEDMIKQLLTTKGGDAKYVSIPTDTVDVSDQQWLKSVNAAVLLSDLFQELSGARYSYNKTKYGVWLTEWLLKNDAASLEDLKAYLVRILVTIDEVSISDGIEGTAGTGA